MSELQDIGLLKIKLERDQLNVIAAVPAPSDELGPGPVARASVRVNEHIAQKLCRRVVLRKIDPGVKRGRYFAGGERGLN